MAAILTQRSSPDGGIWDGVSSIQGHLSTIEATFVILSMSDKQKALQLIITFLQKLEISTYDVPSRQRGTEELYHQQQLTSSQALDSLTCAPDNSRSEIGLDNSEDVRPAAADPQQYLLDLRILGNQSNSKLIEVKCNSSVNNTNTSSSSHQLPTSISRREKAAHLNSDYVWGEECDENLECGSPANAVSEHSMPKAPKRETTRSSNRLKGRRKAKKGVSPDEKEGEEEEIDGDRDHVDGIGICDGRTPEEVDAAVVLDKIIDCLENGLQYKGAIGGEAEKEISEEALSKAGQVANPNKIEFFARQAMKPYLVNLKTNPEAITLTDAIEPVTPKASSTLTCFGCDKSFSRRRNLQTHLQQDHEKAELSCRKCQRAFMNPEEWLLHGCVKGVKPKNIVSKSSVEVYCCPICQVLMESAIDLQKHLFDHVKNQCRICLQMHATKRELTTHMQTEHDSSMPESVFICRFCQRRFLKITALYLHLKVHAQGDQKVCFKCGYLCETAADFEKHKQAHTLHAQFTCDKCSSTFDRRHHFQSHLRCHQKWDCSMCDVKHSHRRAFEQHCKRDHGLRLIETRTYSCPHCNTVEPFSSRYKLRLHITELHSVEKPFVCNICKLSFAEEAKLKKHEESETHLLKTGLLPQDEAHTFPCSSCESVFIKKEHLDRHQKVHTEDRPFSCSLCPFSCKEKANLKNHMKRHTSNRDFVCMTCGKGFQTKKTLEDHFVYVHSDQRNFACDSCPRAFKSKKDLLRHRRSVHANIKPHVCKVCNASFKRKALVRNHLLVTHGVTLPTARVKKFDQPDMDESEDVDGSNACSFVENLLDKNRKNVKAKKTQPTPDGSLDETPPTTSAEILTVLPPHLQLKVTTSLPRAIQPRPIAPIKPRAKRTTKDTFLRQMLAESESSAPLLQNAENSTYISFPSLPVDLRVSQAPSSLPKKAPTRSRQKRGTVSYSRSSPVLMSPVVHGEAPVMTSSNSMQSSMPDSSMTEIIVTVDSDGAIMDVDGAAGGQTFIPVKDTNGETTFVPLPMSSSQVAEFDSQIGFSIVTDHAHVHASSPSPSNDPKTILISTDSSQKELAHSTASLTSSGFASSDLGNQGFQYSVVKALKGLDVRLPPSIAAMEEERVVDGISIDASTLPSVSGFSPQVSPSGGLFRPGSLPALAHVGLPSLHDGVKGSLALAAVRPAVSGDASLRLNKSATISPHPNREQFTQQLVTGEDGEAYYLMETDQKEPQEIYYVVSDVAHFM